MKYICKPISRAAIAIMPLAAIALTVFLVSCSKGGSSAKPDNVDYYTCTMHPSVKSQDPNAKCPICGMDLVPVKKKGAAAEHDHGQKPADATGMKDMKGMEGMKGMPGMQKEEMKEEEPGEFMVPVS